MMTETAFNSAPIMLQPPTKTSSSMMMTSEQDILSNMFYHSHVSSTTYYQQDEDDEDDAMLPVLQHLDPEQINYEFPPKSHLKALSYLDQLEEEYSFFDETSFTSLSNDSSSSSASSASLLSGYFEDMSITTTPPTSQQKSFFSSLIDEKDLDLTRISHHMLIHQQQDYQSENCHHEILQQNQSTSIRNPNNIVDDNKLSPLQLPAQAQQTQWIYNHQRELSCDSSTTITKEMAIVAPQSFLSMPSVSLYKSNHHVDPSALVHSSTHVTQIESSLSRRYSEEELDLPIIISETEPILEQDHGDDNNSMTSDYLYPQQQTILIKISNKHTTNINTINNINNKQPYRRPTSLTYLASDEGYDDDDKEEKLGNDCEIESASVFLPLEQDDDDTRVNQMNGCYGNNNDDMTQTMWSNFLQQQEQWTARIQHLEQQLIEERAMRQAFEKAMEDMTVLMDQQQKVLYDRLEQEISMREAYENKMQQTIAHVDPLEQQLEKETSARIQLEETMVHVLNQLECLQTQHQQHVNDDTDQRKRMQKKLDQVLNDISKVEAAGSAAAAAAAPGVSTKSTSRPIINTTITTTTSARPTPSGIITNTKSSHSRTTTITNKSGTSSIVRTPQSRSRPSKVITTITNNNNKRSTPISTTSSSSSSSSSIAKSGLESQQQKQPSTSSSRRLVFHR